MELPARVLALLEERGETVATAESLTGGRLAAALTGVPGASRTYVGGVVAYATSVKEELLGVPAALVERYGVISAECALAMARGAAGVTGAAWGIGTTGVAGPDGQDGHPPGTVHVGLVGPGVSTVTRPGAGGRPRGDPGPHLPGGTVGAGGHAFPSIVGAPGDEPREDAGLG